MLRKKKNIYVAHVQIILSLRFLPTQYPYLKGSYVVKYVEWKKVTVFFKTQIPYSAERTLYMNVPHLSEI